MRKNKKIITNNEVKAVKRHVSKWFSVIFSVLLAISGVSLSILNNFGRTGVKGMITGGILSVAFWVYSARKIKNVSVDWTLAGIAVVISVVTLRRASLQYSLPVILAVASFLTTVIAVYAVIECVKQIYRNLIQNCDDKRFMILSSFILSVCVIVLYSISDQLYQQYDKVFSMDGGWVFNNMYPCLNYYDIRHPVISIIYYPVFCSAYFFLRIIGAYSVTNIAILIQLVHVQLWILTAVMLGKITDSRWTKYIYIVSGPILLNVFFFEKFSLLVFLLVVTVYLIKENDDRYVASIAVCSGSILTSCVIAFGILLNKGLTIKNRVRDLCLSVVYTMLFFAAFGRVGTLVHALPEMYAMRGFLGTLSWKERIYSYLNMIGSSLISITSDITPDRIWWVGLTTSINGLSIILIVISLWIIVINRRETIIQIASIWLLLSVILVLIAGWSISESPLFAVYFSWALIVIIIKGMQKIAKITKLEEKKLFVPTTVIMFGLNMGTTLPVVFSTIGL